MIEYLLVVALLIEGLDIAGIAARFEMYKRLKRIRRDKRYNISAGVYSRVCFYMIPGDEFIKLTKMLPLTYLFDRKMKNILKGMTYNGEDILELLERLGNLKWDDIKDKKLPIK